MKKRQYRIVGEPGEYQIIEQFGDYRASKKYYKSPAAAYERIISLGGECENPEILEKTAN